MKKTFLSLLLLAFSFSLYAQEVVTWQFKSRKIDNETLELVMTASIEDEWYMYSTKPGDGPMPTEFTFTSGPEYELVGGITEPNPPKEKLDEGFGSNVRIFEYEAVFVQKIKRLTEKAFTVKGSISYQSCSGESCMMFEKDVAVQVAADVIQKAEPPKTADASKTTQGASTTANTTANTTAATTASTTAAVTSAATTGQKVEKGAVQEEKKMGEPNVQEKPKPEGGASEDVLPESGATSQKSDNPDVTVAESQKSDNPDVAVTESQKADNPNVVVAAPQKSSRESIWGFILAAILAGLACILTPCVFPMIPMTVGFFVSGSRNKAQTVTKATVFWLSVGFVYGLVGCIIAIFKSDSFAQIISTHWIPNLLFAFMFIIFAASFFGMFEINLPSGMANKADRQVDKGGIIASFFMAIVMAIVSFACTGPFVGSLISEAVKGSAVIKPIFGFVCFGLAMGAPFLIFAIFPSVMKKLPKSGGWLNSVKVIFAFIMLGFSLKFIVQVDDFFGWSLISREVGIGFWIVLSVLMGIYILGKIKFSHDSDVPHVSVPRLILAIFAFTFGIYLIPGLFGADLETVSAFLPAKEKQAFDLTKNVGVATSATGTKGVLSPEGSAPKYAGLEPRMALPDNIPGFYDLNEAKAYAQKVNKPIFLDFTGIFCSNCKKMKSSAFKDPRVVEMINSEYVFVALYTDVKTIQLAPEEQTVSHQGKPIRTMGELYAEYQLQKFDVRSQPYFAVIDFKENVMVKDLGYVGADELFAFLQRGLAAYKK